MTEYTSKQVAINKPDELIYRVLSDFNSFTPILQEKVEEWQATEDSCSFKASGFTVKLKMVEREPYKTIKLTGEDIPFEFYFWVQLKSVDVSDTRLRITVKAKLNTMMKMMVGGKLQKGIDNLAEMIAGGFNQV